MLVGTRASKPGNADADHVPARTDIPITAGIDNTLVASIRIYPSIARRVSQCTFERVIGIARGHMIVFILILSALPAMVDYECGQFRVMLIIA